MSNITKVLLIFLLLNINLITSLPFPKTLWIFWDKQPQSSNFITLLCINNMKHFTKQANWTLNFLSTSNYTKFISAEGNALMNKLTSTTKYHIGIQQKLDIFRLILLYQNGGMWIDTNSIFLNDLRWVDQIQKYYQVDNVLGGEPEFFGFTYGDVGGNQTVVYDSYYHKNVKLFPELEIWSFLCKPNSTFIKDVLSSLQTNLFIPFQTLHAQNIKQGVRFGTSMSIPFVYFIISNYQFQTVLQKRQIDIDTHPQKYNTKYAVDYYKIWSTYAGYAGYTIYQLYNWNHLQIVSFYFTQNKQQFQIKTNMTINFLKQNWPNYNAINVALSLLDKVLCVSAFDNLDKRSILMQYLFKYTNSKIIDRFIRIDGMEGGERMKSQECDDLTMMDYKFLFNPVNRLIRFMKWIMGIGVIVMGGMGYVIYRNYRVEENQEYQGVGEYQPQQQTLIS